MSSSLDLRPTCVTNESNARASVPLSLQLVRSGGCRPCPLAEDCKASSGLELCRSEAVIWCRSCWHRNGKHAVACDRCGDQLHGLVNPSGEDCFVSSASLLGRQLVCSLPSLE
eukprot:TRINITY_DN2369_c0_g1_i13.p1 TRINITY_DN2369_c0_g1~~TRINITY_DN2369_c0_g1_i13.p1  ORF type:complete len:113 (-),score=9.94 TRINITY_DN2369_c0_g1_i13:231-569(-)